MLTLADLLDAAERHPLYADWDFSGVSHFADPAWRRLPTLDRDRLAEYSPATSGPEMLFYSSGTTATPNIVRYSPADLERVAELCARFARLEGVGTRSRVMVLLPICFGRNWNRDGYATTAGTSVISTRNQGSVWRLRSVEVSVPNLHPPPTPQRRLPGVQHGLSDCI